jgi:serine protease Do/serine protease DegQ
VALGGQTGEVPSLAPLLKKVTPGVVNVAIKGRIAQQQNPLLNDPFFRRFFGIPDEPRERLIRAAGSGVVIDSREGLIITNNHVIQHADQHADEITITLIDGRQLEGKRIGADPETDVALIKVTAEDLTAIPFGDSDKLEIGNFVVAIGNPFQIGQTVTSGIVSGLRRSGLGIEQYEDFAADLRTKIGLLRVGNEGRVHGPSRPAIADHSSEDRGAPERGALEVGRPLRSRDRGRTSIRSEKRA